MDPDYGDDIMGKSQGMHGESMGNAFRTTISWGNHGECMGESIRNDFGISISWGNHGECMGNPWECLSNAFGMTI
jgi:hypothetical protein